jgi:hypothetical protein
MLLFLVLGWRVEAWQRNLSLFKGGLWFSGSGFVGRRRDGVKGLCGLLLR